VAKLTNTLWNIATEEGYSTTMPKVSRVLWNTVLILTPINIVLYLVYLISPYSSTSYYFTTPVAFLSILVVIAREIYAHKKKKGYPLTWTIIGCINADIFLIGWFLYHIIVIK